MGTFISKRHHKWNNYYKKLTGTDKETADYIYHLQQQIDYLERKLAQLATDFDEYKKGHDDNCFISINQPVAVEKPIYNVDEFLKGVNNDLE